ncbi:PE family protein [Mycobacterium interjectum]|nr:PE family protein [Mycobacterium interjectum]
MSFVVVAPEFVTAAAGDLANIGSALTAAQSAAAGSTTGITAAAADEVSSAIALLFNAHALDFQALGARAAAFHSEFVSLLNGGAATYLSTETAAAQPPLRRHRTSLTRSMRHSCSGPGAR